MNRIKLSLSDLALFGGDRCFESELHVGCPAVVDESALKARFDEILASRRFTNNGPTVREFEARIQSLLGVRHCLAVVNGTIALELIIRALQLDGEVIMPAFTFIATAHAFRWQHVNPVFCDIDPETGTIDPAAIENLITRETSAVLGVHLWGRPCDVSGLEKLAREHGIEVLFDAAPAFGCSYRGRMLGNFGRAEVFSFHATKSISTFEGGAITTNDDELAEKIRLMRNFGFTGRDKVVELGINGKMNEFCAAMGLTSLDGMNEIVGINRRNYEAYCHYLAGINGLQVMQYEPNESHNYQYIVVEIDDSISGISRDNLMDILHAENILARRYFYPGCHKMEPYRSMNPNGTHTLPATEAYADRVLQLPTGLGISVDDIHQIADLIRFVVDRGQEVTTGIARYRLVS